MRPFNNTPLVNRLQGAHGVVLGKTRMHELAFGGSTIAPGYHTTLNPYSNLAHAGGGFPCLAWPGLASFTGMSVSGMMMVWHPHLAWLARNSHTAF